MTAIPWTEERIARAKELYLEGASARMIARELDTTRNAVIGIIHRKKWRFLGMRARLVPPGRPLGAKDSAPRKRRANIVPKGFKWVGEGKVAPAARLPPQEESETPEGLEPLAEFHTNGGCTWITGEPTYDAATCGRPLREGSSWCTRHHRMVWVAPRKRQISMPRWH
jgi:hypothetical protein